MSAPKIVLSKIDDTMIAVYDPSRLLGMRQPRIKPNAAPTMHHVASSGPDA